MFQSLSEDDYAGVGHKFAVQKCYQRFLRNGKNIAEHTCPKSSVLKIALRTFMRGLPEIPHTVRYCISVTSIFSSHYRTYGIECINSEGRSERKIHLVSKIS